MNMKSESVRSSIACGLSAVIASVSLAGCAGLPYINRPMYTEDLSRFMVDCTKRDQQIQFLLGQLSTNDDRLLAWWTNYMNPVGPVTNNPDYALRVDIASRMTNWQVGQNLLHIKRYCG
jgi:hypothetical protein